MKSIMGKVLDTGESFGRAKLLRASGWRGGYKRTGVQVGYHRQLPRADMKLLAFKLERGL